MIFAPNPVIYAAKRKFIKKSSTEIHQKIIIRSSVIALWFFWFLIFFCFSAARGLFYKISRRGPRFPPNPRSFCHISHRPSGKPYATRGIQESGDPKEAQARECYIHNCCSLLLKDVGSFEYWGFPFFLSGFPPPPLDTFDGHRKCSVLFILIFNRLRVRIEI